MLLDQHAEVRPELRLNTRVVAGPCPVRGSCGHLQPWGRTSSASALSASTVRAFFGSVRSAVTIVDGIAVCQMHAKELLRKRRNNAR